VNRQQHHEEGTAVQKKYQISRPSCPLLGDSRGQRVTSAAAGQRGPGAVRRRGAWRCMEVRAMHIGKQMAGRDINTTRSTIKRWTFICGDG
jgi:hypothetical protein